jgi:hypothetical protein
LKTAVEENFIKTPPSMFLRMFLMIRDNVVFLLYRVVTKLVYANGKIDRFSRKISKFAVAMIKKDSPGKFHCQGYPAGIGLCMEFISAMWG